ncbi:MAG: S9 family peptidase [Planctomycetota bacterium]
MHRLTARQWRTRFVPVTAVIALLALAPPVRSSDAGLTPHQVASLRGVAEAKISPDGTQIAYTLSVPRKPGVDKDGPPWRELHLVDAGGGDPRPFVTGEVNVSAIAWLPDGRHLSFLAKRGEDKQTTLYLIPADGGEARRLVALESSIESYDWNPEGTRVTLIARESAPEERKKWREKGFAQEVFEEDWRPFKLWISSPFEAATKPQALDLPGSAFQAVWNSREGDGRLLVALGPTPSTDHRYMRQKLYVVEPAGRVVHAIENPGKLEQIAFEGDEVVMISGADLNDPGAGRLLEVNLATPSREPLDLLPSYNGDVQAFGFGGDGILFVGWQGVWSFFGETALQPAEHPGEGTHEPVPGVPHVIVPPGGPILTSLSLAQQAQRAAFVAHSPSHPGELYMMSHGEAGPRRLTFSNPWLEGMRLARQEVITYKARDGLELEGILVSPLEESVGRPWPTIVSAHGGPEAHQTNGWLTRYASPGQVASARGFAVFYPNYRGSTGRGPAFNKLGQGDAAGKEFDDIVDGVDHLIRLGVTDRDRVGITGGSYGGYAAAWCSTYYSDRFAAGVVFAGISDLVSKIGTTDIPLEEYLVHSRRYPWENWQSFLERSPIYYVAKAHTPLLILHGKDDSRVHVSQALELYRHLKTLQQAPVRLVLYPGEGHGNRNAAACLDLSLRMLRWFEHYLKGPGGAPPAHELDYGEKASAKE